MKRANSGNGGKRFSRFALPVSSRASAQPVGLDSSLDASTTDGDCKCATTNNVTFLDYVLVIG